MFLANENFPAPSIALIRAAGFSVKSIREESPGIADEDVLRMAAANALIILTFDKDYGEIIFRHGLPAPPSVIFFRAKGANPEWSAQRLLKILLSGRQFNSSFTIVEEESVRQRMY